MSEPDAANDLVCLIEENRDRLRRMIELRMDRRLRPRLDASDIVQEACEEAFERTLDDEARGDMPPYVWLRWLAQEKLLQAYRRHLGAQARDARREAAMQKVSLDENSVPLIEAIAQSTRHSPSRVVSRDEIARKLPGIVEGMSHEDREVILLRHFEGLRNVEVAQILGLSEPAASLRYTKANSRLAKLLQPLLGSGTWT